MTKAKAAILLLWVVALSLAAWTLSQLPLQDMVPSLRRLNAEDYLIWAGANVAVIVLLNYRWWLICQAANAPVAFFTLLLIKQAGQSISFITPGPQFGGEPMQLYWLCRRAKLPLANSLLSLGLDRVFELSINFFVLLIGVALLMGTPASAAANWVSMLALLVGVLLSLTVLLWLLGRLMSKDPQWLIHRLTRLTHHWRHHKYFDVRAIDSLNAGWASFQHTVRHSLQEGKVLLVGAGLVSIVSWLGLLVELVITLWIADVKISYPGLLLLFVALRLALLLPLPGGIGTMEAAIFWTFEYLNLGAASALTIIALMRLRDVIVLILGLLSAMALQSTLSNKSV